MAPLALGAAEPEVAAMAAEASLAHLVQVVMCQSQASVAVVAGQSLACLAAERALIQVVVQAQEPSAEALALLVGLVA